MFYKLSFLFLLSLISKFHSHPPFPFEEEIIDYEKLEKNLTKEYNEFRKKYKRRLSGDLIYIEPEINSVLFNTSLIQTLSVKIKAQGDISQITLYDQLVSVQKSELLLCELKIEDNNKNNIKLGKNDTCILRNNYYIDINTNLKNGYILSLKVQIYNSLTNSKDVLHQSRSFYILPMFPGIKTKFLFNVDPSIVKVEFSYGESYVKRYNETAFIFDDICPDSAQLVIIYVTPYEMKWEYNLEIIAKVKSKPSLLYFSIPKKFMEFGNIFHITKNENKTNIDKNLNLSEKSSDAIYDNDDSISYQMYHAQVGDIYYKRNIEFSTRPNNWRVPSYLDEKWENSSTSESISLAKQILEEDASEKPDYYKIGKWVYNNIQYNLTVKYDIPSGLNNTEYHKKHISEIIAKRQGVCHDYTKLYNALLDSIGIKSVYVSGYVFYKYDYDAPNHLLDVGHAWTLAKINNEWLPLDSTWNYFEGVFRQNHIYGPSSEPFAFAYDWDSPDYKADVDFEIKEEIKFKEIVQNPFRVDVTETPKAEIPSNDSFISINKILIILYTINLLFFA